MFDSLQLHNGKTREGVEMRTEWEIQGGVRECDETQKAAKSRKKRQKSNQMFTQCFTTFAQVEESGETIKNERIVK